MATYDEILPASPFQRVTTPSRSASPFQRETGGLDDIFTDNIPDTGQVPAGPSFRSGSDVDRIKSPGTDFFRRVERDPGLSSLVKDEIINAALSNKVNLSKIRAGMDANKRAKRLGDIRIQHDELRLSEARRQAQEAQTEPVHAGRVGSEMKAVMGAPGLTDLQKRNALAAIRMNNSVMFTKSGALRDMYATGISTLNVPSPVTDAELRARRGEKARAEGRAEEARREPIEAKLEYLDKDYEAIQGSKRTAQPYGSTDPEKRPDTFLNPDEGDAVQNFVEQRKQFLTGGAKVATKHSDLMIQAREVYERERASLDAQKFGTSGSRPGGLGALNLPSR